jgi:hypothetical protein
MTSTDYFFEKIINSLESGDINKLEQVINQISLSKISETLSSSTDKNFKNKIEKSFYKGLARCLETSRFETFVHMLDYAINFDFFVDVKRIPNRIEIITNLLGNALQGVDLGEIIEILRFSNQYNIIEKEISKEDLKQLKEIKKDKLLLANLNDLFGEPSKDFILFVYKVMPNNLYEFFTEYLISYGFGSTDAFNIGYVMNYLNQYSVYGLSVKLLGKSNSFFKRFEKKELLENEKIDNKIDNTSTEEIKMDNSFIEFDFKNEKHLVSPENLTNIKLYIISDNLYKFYNLSMVMLGGIGPQGHGFTYSTPKGEVVEICSDIRENDAIIVKYKEFLKQQFIKKLENELESNLQIDKNIRYKIINYLLDVLDQNELINYYKRDIILKKINEFLNRDETHLNDNEMDLHELIKKISNAINVILRKIRMEDQFRTRMELVSQNQLKSEDIAKLTSLREKSHYDVLRERFFFQYIVDWFYEIYKEEQENYS